MARNIDIPMYNSLELLLMCLKLMMMIAHHDVCPNLNENDYSLDVDYHFLALSFSNQQLVVHDFHSSWQLYGIIITTTQILKKSNSISTGGRAGWGGLRGGDGGCGKY